jgi:8-oxo-dGTP diphosphatase
MRPVSLQHATMSNERMPHIATGLLFDRTGRLLIYLRDNIPSIPFPDHWDLFGGFVEDGESPEQALVREVDEELGIRLSNYEFYKTYECLEGDVRPNIKHVYCGRVDATPTELVLREGQRLASIALDERHGIRFANILGRIVDEFAASNTLTARYTQPLSSSG